MKLKNYIKLLLTGLTLAACSSDPVDGPDQPGVTPPPNPASSPCSPAQITLPTPPEN